MVQVATVIVFDPGRSVQGRYSDIVPLGDHLRCVSQSLWLTCFVGY